jgi:hypothetical protein
VGGVGSVLGPYPNGPNSQPKYVWQTGGAKAHAVMELLRPYLCHEPKVAKYDALREVVSSGRTFKTYPVQTRR